MKKIRHTQLVRDTHYSGLRFARRTYMPRIFGLAIGSFCVGSAITGLYSTDWIWLILFFNGFIWPHIAYLKAAHSASPYKSEIHNLQIDALCTGAWIALMGFNALPSAVLLAMTGMNNIAAGGPSLFFRCLVGQIVVALALFYAAALPLSIETSSMQIYFCLPMIIVYPIFLGSVTFNTARKLAEHKQAIMQISICDGLTGLFNRHHWESLLEGELEKFQRYHHKTTLVLIDVDRFKEINDNYGHSTGDRAIIIMARELRQSLRATDIIGRYGGDEFAVILPHSTERLAQYAIRRLQKRLDAVLFPEYPELHLFISAGIAECDGSQKTAEHWLNAADRALYTAKRNGRNQVAVAADQNIQTLSGQDA